MGRSASFTCPICGNTGTLLDHAISPEGKVTPSVVCSFEGCVFHEFVRLAGWREAKKCR